MLDMVCFTVELTVDTDIGDLLDVDGLPHYAIILVIISVTVKSSEKTINE